MNRNKFIEELESLYNSIEKRVEELEEKINEENEIDEMLTALIQQNECHSILIKIDKILKEYENKNL